MEQNIFDWVISIPCVLSQFTSWLFTKLPYINLTPISIFTLTGISAILVFHLIKLVNPTN